MHSWTLGTDCVASNSRAAGDIKSERLWTCWWPNVSSGPGISLEEMKRAAKTKTGQPVSASRFQFWIPKKRSSGHSRPRCSAEGNIKTETAINLVSSCIVSVCPVLGQAYYGLIPKMAERRSEVSTVTGTTPCSTVGGHRRVGVTILSPSARLSVLHHVSGYMIASVSERHTSCVLRFEIRITRWFCDPVSNQHQKNGPVLTSYACLAQIRRFALAAI